MKKKTDVAIIGGGISGMEAASALSRNGGESCSANTKQKRYF
jgi:cation diffusion facilitator CzcD-associated flavoprotein CzcO